MSFRRIVSVLLACLVVAACGGGGDDQTSVQEVQTAVSVQGTLAVRLNFGSGNVTGFAFPASVGDEVRWHSGMVSANFPAAPHGVIQQAPDGSLFAELQLYYTADRGIFAIYPKGTGTVAMVQGQPMNHMLVRNWVLSANLKPTVLPDGRVWLDVSF